MTNDDNILTVANLNVAYGESKALFDVSMNVRARQVVACVGRNGAGKSTLLKSITGFLKPASGSIVSDGISLVGRPAFAVAGIGHQIHSPGQEGLCRSDGAGKSRTRQLCQPGLRLGPGHRRISPSCRC